MRNPFLVILLLLFCNLAISQAVVINELDCDTPSTDTQEFIELKTPTPNTALDGYVLVLYNGNTDLSYYTLDLDGLVTDNNGLLLLGSTTVTPFPQVIIPTNIIQNGTDAITIYQANDSDFPIGTLATSTNLIDALVYETNDAENTDFQALLGESFQIDENLNGNKDTESITLNNDGTSYTVGTPSPRELNDGTGFVYTPINITTSQNQYNEGDSFDIVFSTLDGNPVTTDVSFNFLLNNSGFNTSDFTGNTSVTIPTGQSSISVPITLIDDTLDEGDEIMSIRFQNLQSPYIIYNNYIKISVIDNDFLVQSYGTPTNPTFGVVTSTQPSDYYNSINGLADAALKQELQNIVADPTTVRAQTYADVIDILKDADVNPLNSNEVWLLYTEQSRSKLDLQSSGSNVGKWNREHTFPRSLGGFGEIDDDDDANGINNYWTTEADSTRHAYSDAHALRAADGPENSSRGNKHYGQYNGPTGNMESFKGDVARSVLFLEIRYNGLSIENGFPTTVGQMGDLATLLDWHRNDPPDDFEMNRNNVVYTWQFNRNPLIDMPELVEYIWGNNIGDTWNNNLNVENYTTEYIKIYPNPATDQLFISGLNEDFKVVIFSSEGRELQSETLQNKTPLSLKLPSGMYFLKITSKNKTEIKKFVVK